ncbi:MAG: transposase family protein [Planctomycetaceae bacterium]
MVSHFESHTILRARNARTHLLTDVMVIAVCAILCGTHGPTAIHRWAVSRQARRCSRPYTSSRRGWPLPTMLVGRPLASL